MDVDFSLETTGFDMGEIDMRIEGLGGPPAAQNDPADALPPPTSDPPVSQLGDLWQLGRHRLLCGSALDAASYVALMGGKPARLVITDPPYNVCIEGHVSGLGKIHHHEFVMASGEMSPAEFTRFLADAMARMAQHATDGALLYLFMDWRHMTEMLNAAAEVGLVQKNLCVWKKDNAGMGSLYRSQHELVFVFKHGTAAHRNNVELGRHGRNRTNIWCYPGVNSFRRSSGEGDLLALHPTVKPVQLIADAMLDASARGDIVLEPFGGSGSTLIAAERVGRRCYAMELDAGYCDTIVQRWQRFTGATASHVGTGQSFADCAAQRATSRERLIAVQRDLAPVAGGQLTSATSTRETSHVG